MALAIQGEPCPNCDKMIHYGELHWTDTCRKQNLDGICHEKHVPINIDEKTRDRLNAYLYNQAPRGQGFSAFIEQALDAVGARKND